MRELRLAVRGLFKSKVFTLIALCSLAVGVGANATIFQLINALTLRRLPVAHPEELAFVRVSDSRWSEGHRRTYGDSSNPVFERLRSSQQAFSSVTAFEDCGYLLGSAGEAHWAPGLCVSGNFFATLGVAPLLGRVFTPADDQRSCSSLIAVVSYDFWQRELAGDPAVIGRKIALDQLRYEVVGVTPRGFTGPLVGQAVNVTVPLCLDEMYGGGTDHSLDESWVMNLNVIGRLRPGWTLERASAHVAALSPAIMDETVPPLPVYTTDEAARYRLGRLEAVSAATGLSVLRDRYGGSLYLLLGIAALVLLIACANLANLLLARASAREREIAVRLALGAPRGRLVRELMVESLLLAGVGAALGLVLAYILTPALVALLPRPEDIVMDLSPDWRVVGFTAALAGLTCLFFGLVPALRASRADVGLVLKATASHATEGRERLSLRRFLVAAQVALSFVLLVGALLFARSLHNVTAVHPGFRVAGITRASINLDPLRHRDADWHAPEQQLVDEIGAIPGVERATFAGMRLLRGQPGTGPVWSVDSDRPRSTDVVLDVVGPGAFATLDIPLRSGRDFDVGDRAGAPDVAVVNERFGRAVFDDSNPIGKRFSQKRSPQDRREYEIVGVIGNTKVGSLRDEVLPIAYLPRDQHLAGARVEVDIRSSLPGATLREAVVRQALAASPSAIVEFGTYEEWLHESLAGDRLMASLAGLFGGLAAFLAAAGLYGVFSYSVSRRSREIAIRMALGANAGRVGRMVLLEAGWLLAGGLAVGCIVALFVTRAAKSLLYGLTAHDPLTFVVAATLLAAVAVIAGLPASCRAARVEPMVTLRQD